MRFEHTVTRHGSPLYVFPMPHVGSVAVGVLVFAGTRDEKWPHDAGLAHALEHMLFQGNKRLTSSREITEEIEIEGGGVNAWTAKEMTFYHRIVPASAFEVAVNSLCSQMTTPLFREVDVVKEMKNVVQEIRRAYDSPASFCQRYFDCVVYGTHPLGKDTLGTEEAVLAFRNSDFHIFHTLYYHPKNFVFIVAGNTTLSEAERAFNSADFGMSTRCGKNERPKSALLNTLPSSEVVERENVQQANVCFGVHIGPSDDPDTKALGFYSAMLDGGMSFPLFQEVRDKHGLCYAVSADITPWTDYGMFRLYIGTAPDRVSEAVECIHGVVQRCSHDEVLFEKARKYLLGSNAISFSSPSAVLSRAAQDIVFSGKPKSPAEIEQEIREQTLAGVQQAVGRYLEHRDHYSYMYVVPQGTKI